MEPKPDESAGQREERARSPFPTIPDVVIEQEVVEHDIQTFKSHKSVESALRPSSPFPSVPDVTLNPEIVEKDIVALRTSPVPFKVQSSLDEVIPPPPQFRNSGPFPTIPDISKYLVAEKCESKLLRPVATKQFAPVSLTDKKYQINCYSPILDMAPKPSQPEFSYALGHPEQRVSEWSFRGETPEQGRTIQSEIFESQGHFNARAKSPIKVFVPEEVTVEETVAPTKPEIKEQPHTKIVIEKVSVEPRNPEVEEHARKCAIENCKEKAEAMVYQQGCFNELKHIKQAYDVVDHYAIKGMKGVDIEYKDSSEVAFKEVVKEPPAPPKKSEEPVTSNEPSKPPEVVRNTKKVNGIQPEEMNLDIEPKICKKPPGAIIGARPLFGELNINDEFKKALVGKKKSWQEKRIKNATQKTHQYEQQQSETKQENTANSSLTTTVKSNEKAEVELIRPNSHEEVEKVFYEQNREIDVDFQVVNGEVTNGFAHPQIKGQKPEAQYIEIVNNTEQEDYVKIPVKSLIETFEQSIMPPMQYKQIREPLPDVVEKLAPSRSPGVEEITKLKQAEQEFDNIYYVTSSKVENSTYPKPDPNKVYSIQPSENSSFCKYSTSQVSQYFSETSSESRELLQTGKA